MFKLLEAPGAAPVQEREEPARSRVAAAPGAAKEFRSEEPETPAPAPTTARVAAPRRRRASSSLAHFNDALFLTN